MKRLSTFMSLVCVLTLQAVAQMPDSVTFVQGSDCCFDFTVKNRNSGQIPINDFHITVQTQGAAIRLQPGPTAPSVWTVSSAQTNTVSFVSLPGSVGIRAGMQLSGFNVCFNTVVSVFTIEWRTTNANGGTISQGTLNLTCPVTCDNVVPTHTGNCCFDWSITNANSLRSPINDFHVNILTTGVTFGTLTPATNWSIVSQTSQSVTFNASPTGAGIIPPGGSLKGFITCFNLPTGSTGAFNVEWITTISGQPICRDTITLQCAVPACDSVQVTPLGDCCYRFKVKNRNSGLIPISDFHLNITTAGVTVRPTPVPPAGWSQAHTPNSVDFITTATPLQPGNDLDGFVVCFDFAGGNAFPFQITWRTTQPGATICSGTMNLQCALTPKCDTVEVSTSTSGPCCYELKLKNEHTPSGPLNDLHLKILSPATSFVSSTVGGPWPTSSVTATEINWVSPVALLSGQDMPGFKFCLSRTPNAPVAVKILWESTFNGGVICADTLTVLCDVVTQERCDTIRVKALNNCCFDFGVLNRHTPAGLVNDFHLALLTPGAAFRQPPTTPSGWNILTATNTIMNFVTSSNPILPNTFLGGFIVCFDNVPASGIVQVKWTTTLDGKPLCVDSLYLKCNEDPPVCDSVVIEKRVDECCFDLKVKNRHFPQSFVDDLHLRVLTTGVTIRQNAIPPSGWFVTSSTLNTLSFSGPNAPIFPGVDLSGFIVCFDAPANLQQFKVLWTTTLAGTVLCEDTLTFDCTPQKTCDDVRTIKTLENCCFEFEIRNTHTPAGLLNDWHLKVLTTGTTIRPTPTFPTNWQMTTLTATQVDFKEATGSGVPPNGSVSGFIICFDNVPATGVIQLEWCTTLDGNIICCDTIFVQCSPIPGQCDEVEFSLIDTTRCCYDFTVKNVHQPPSTLTDFHVRLLTSGVGFISALTSAPSGWTLNLSGTAANYVATTAPIPTGNTQSGFKVCFDPGNLGTQPFKVIWETTRDGAVVCTDTITVNCPKPSDVEQLPGTIPDAFALYQNYPNPFNPTTSIAFDIARQSDVEVTVYDAGGRTRIIVVNERLSAGRYEVTFDASTLSSGTYFYRLRAGDFVQTRAMVLVK